MQGRRLEAVRLFDTDDGDAIPDLAPPANSNGGDVAFALEPAPPIPVPLPTPDPKLAAPAMGALAKRRQLREQNSDAVTDLARMTGKSHAEVNADLNRRL